MSGAIRCFILSFNCFKVAKKITAMRDYKVLPQALISIAANGGPFLYGIALGWSAPSGPMLLDPRNEFEMTPNEFSWAVSLMPLGGAMFCVISGLFRSRFGTKFTILAFALPNLVGWILMIFAKNSTMVIVGRLLVGIAGGAYAFNIPVFIGEIASKEIRGILLTLYQVSVKLGVVFVYTLGYFTNFFILNTICAALLVIYTFGFMFLPETPIFLVRKNQSEKAEKSIRTLRGDKYNAKLELSYLQELQAKASNEPKSSFMAEFRNRSTFRAFVLIVTLFFFFQMSGVNAILFYTTSIFIQAGVTLDPALATIIIGLTQVIATLATAAFVDRFGRVVLLGISFSVMILSLFGIGTFFYLLENDSILVERIRWLPLPSLCLFCVGFSSGLGSVPFILLGEFFSSDAKKVIAPFSQTMSFVMSFVVGNLYPDLANHIGTGLSFYMFAGFCFVGLLFTILFIPETKGKSLDEIQSMLGRKGILQ